MSYDPMAELLKKKKEERDRQEKERQEKERQEKERQAIERQQKEEEEKSKKQKQTAKKEKAKAKSEESEESEESDEESQKTKKSRPKVDNEELRSKIDQLERTIADKNREIETIKKQSTNATIKLSETSELSVSNVNIKDLALAVENLDINDAKILRYFDNSLCGISIGMSDIINYALFLNLPSSQSDKSLIAKRQMYQWIIRLMASNQGVATNFMKVDGETFQDFLITLMETIAFDPKDASKIGLIKNKGYAQAERILREGYGKNSKVYVKLNSGVWSLQDGSKVEREKSDYLQYFNMMIENAPEFFIDAVKYMFSENPHLEKATFLAIKQYLIDIVKGKSKK